MRFYTESEQDYKFYDAVPLGITHSWQICSSKSAKNEYIILFACVQPLSGFEHLLH